MFMTGTYIVYAIITPRNGAVVHLLPRNKWRLGTWRAWRKSWRESVGLPVSSWWNWWGRYDVIRCLNLPEPVTEKEEGDRVV